MTSEATILALTPAGCAHSGLRWPAAIEITSDGTAFLAKILKPVGIESFGTGASIDAALKDLVEVMRAEAASLRARLGRLSPDMARELAVIDAALLVEGAEAVQVDAYVTSPLRSGATGQAFNTALSRNSYLPSPSGLL